MEDFNDSVIVTDDECDSLSKKRFLWAQKDSYGFTHGDSKADRLKNYKQYKITIPDPDFYDFKKCLVKIVSLCPIELVQGTVPQKDFKELQEEHIKTWHKHAYSRKYPVANLGLQRHILPHSYKDWKATDLEWFFSEEMGILGIDGKLKADPKCVFVSERMEGVPQIKCELSGYEGWKRHLEPPYTSDMGGEIYMESVCCSANIAHLTFHGMMFREIWGKLGMICVAGKPNMAKTKEILSALHMSSSRQFFFAMKATPEFLQMMCEKVGLMLAYDDNDSLRREEVLGVSRFEGAAIGTKTSGTKQQVGELVLTSNLDTERTDKMKQGRIQVIRKAHAGYQEEPNSLQALDALAELNEALTDPKKPLDFMVRSFSFWFIMVKIPEDLKDGYKKTETEASQMRIWFSMACKRVREITGHSMREVFTIAALNSFPFLYDKLCPPGSECHKNGGAAFYMSVYLPKQCSQRAQIYAKPLEIPTIDLFPRFIVFIRQLKDGIGERLEAVHDPKVLTVPGTFVEEIRIVHTKAKNGELDLFLAISKTEDFCQSYGTTDGISQFVDFIKKQNGLTEYKYSYQKKSIHAVAITMKFFEPLLRKRLFQKLMRQKIAVPAKHYSSSVRRQGSVRMRREAELQTSDNSDYEDTANTVGEAETGGEADTIGEENLVEAREETSGIPSTSVQLASGIPADTEAAPVPSVESSLTDNDPQSSVEGSSVGGMVLGSKKAQPGPLPESITQATTETSQALSIAVAPAPEKASSPPPRPSCSKDSMGGRTLTPGLHDPPLVTNQPGSFSKVLEEALLRSPALPSMSTATPTMPSSQIPAVSNECNMDDLLGCVDNFSDTLAGPIDAFPTFFDPADALQTDGIQERTPVGVSMFRKKASAVASSKSKSSAARRRLSIGKDASIEGSEMTRTRSQSKSVSMEHDFKEGDIIMAHKGRKVAFWFPGKIMKMKTKTCTVEFLDVFGNEDCAKDNIITVDEFMAQKVLKSAQKLFKVPAEYATQFETVFSKISTGK